MLNTNSPNAAKNRQYPAPTSWLMYSLAYSAISVPRATMNTTPAQGPGTPSAPGPRLGLPARSSPSGLAADPLDQRFDTFDRQQRDGGGQQRDGGVAL